MRTQTIALAVTLTLFAGGAACKKLETGAREEFARKYSCPEDRVEVTLRPDVKWGQLTMPPKAGVQPPDEVRNDPGRLAKWQVDQASSGEAKMREHFDSLDVYQVKGCGHDVLTACKHPTSSDGTNMNAVICFDAPPK